MKVQTDLLAYLGYAARDSALPTLSLIYVLFVGLALPGACLAQNDESAQAECHKPRIFAGFGKEDSGAKECREASQRSESKLRERVEQVKAKGGHYECEDMFDSKAGPLCQKPVQDCANFNFACKVDSGRYYNASWVPGKSAPPAFLAGCKAVYTDADPKLNDAKQKYCSCLDTRYREVLTSSELSVLGDDLVPYKEDALVHDLWLFDDVAYVRTNNDIDKRPYYFTGPSRVCKAEYDVAIKKPVN